jgi:hypothetical protein
MRGLATSPAAASAPRRGYASCFYSFGYPSPSCIPAVSCATEGGRCTKQVSALTSIACS